MLGVGFCTKGTNSFASGERPDDGDLIILVCWGEAKKRQMTFVCLLKLNE